VRGAGEEDMHQRIARRGVDARVTGMDRRRRGRARDVAPPPPLTQELFKNGQLLPFHLGEARATPSFIWTIRRRSQLEKNHDQVLSAKYLVRSLEPVALHASTPEVRVTEKPHDTPVPVDERMDPAEALVSRGARHDPLRRAELTRLVDLVKPRDEDVERFERWRDVTPDFPVRPAELPGHDRHHDAAVLHRPEFIRHLLVEAAMNPPQELARRNGEVRLALEALVDSSLDGDVRQALELEHAAFLAKKRRAARM